MRDCLRRLAAFWLLRLIRGFLYGVDPGDPLTLGAAVATIVGVALIAALAPAIRAKPHRAGAGAEENRTEQDMKGLKEKRHR
jgi:hypothetical protein